MLFCFFWASFVVVYCSIFVNFSNCCPCWFFCSKWNYWNISFFSLPNFTEVYTLIKISFTDSFWQYVNDIYTKAFCAVCNAVFFLCYVLSFDLTAWWGHHSSLCCLDFCFCYVVFSSLRFIVLNVAFCFSSSLLAFLDL